MTECLVLTISAVVALTVYIYFLCYACLIYKKRIRELRDLLNEVENNIKVLISNVKLIIGEMEK